MCCGFVHFKSRTRIDCWNVRSLGSLSDQSAQLCSIIDAMKSKNSDPLALSKSHWPGNSISTVHGTNILNSGISSSHLHGVAILLGPVAKSAWDAAGNVFQPVSKRILRIALNATCLSCLLSLCILQEIPLMPTLKPLVSLKPSPLLSSPISCSYWVTSMLVWALIIPLWIKSLILKSVIKGSK